MFNELTTDLAPKNKNKRLRDNDDQDTDTDSETECFTDTNANWPRFLVVESSSDDLPSGSRFTDLETVSHCYPEGIPGNSRDP